MRASARSVWRCTATPPAACASRSLRARGPIPAATGVGAGVTEGRPCARSDEERQRVLTELLPALRGPAASIRSLSENLLGDPARPGDPAARRLLTAVHAEALRLSDIVVSLAGPDHLDLAPVPAHFDEIEVADLLAIARQRVERGGPGGRVEVEAPADVQLRGDVTALSASLARVVRDLQAHPGGDGSA